jgi:hypothetical protein
MSVEEWLIMLDLIVLLILRYLKRYGKMKLSSIRVSNLINFSELGNQPKSVEANLFHLEIISQGSTACSPIPLNEEWLINFGFQRFGNSAYFFDQYMLDEAYLVSGGFDFRQIISSARSLSLKRYVKYVHELQNLYFDLTDKELTIKEKHGEVK